MAVAIDHRSLCIVHGHYIRVWNAAASLAGCILRSIAQRELALRNGGGLVVFRGADPRRSTGLHATLHLLGAERLNRSSSLQDPEQLLLAHSNTLRAHSCVALSKYGAKKHGIIAV